MFHGQELAPPSPLRRHANAFVTNLNNALATCPELFGRSLYTLNTQVAAGAAACHCVLFPCPSLGGVLQLKAVCIAGKLIGL